jgi:hypothetical protein
MQRGQGPAQLVGGARYEREGDRYDGCMHQDMHGRLTSLPSTNGQRNVPLINVCLQESGGVVYWSLRWSHAD